MIVSLHDYELLVNNSDVKVYRCSRCRKLTSSFLVDTDPRGCVGSVLYTPAIDWDLKRRKAYFRFLLFEGAIFIFSLIMILQVSIGYLVPLIVAGWLILKYYKKYRRTFNKEEDTLK